MRRNIRIKSFTLTEILVVLVIGAIVIGLAFSVLNLVQRNLSAIKENYAIRTNVQHLRKQLAVDFNRFHNIQYDSGKMTLRLKNPGDSINYNFSDQLVVRNHDTAAIFLERVHFYFLGKPISEGKVDAIKLILEKPPKSFIFVSRKNDARDYFD